jgi:hypothetical protein
VSHRCDYPNGGDPQKGRAMRRYLWLTLAAPLAACASILPITGADENGGTVNMVATPYGEDAAMEAARRHCEKYHRLARLANNDQASNSMTFTCEDPNRPVFQGPAGP